MKYRALFIGAAAVFLSAASADAATLVASYGFNNSFASGVGGAPNLVVTDPTASGGFLTDNVNGTIRTVYQTGGNSENASQGGLTFDSTGLLTADSYSVALTFAFLDGGGAWRRILDVENRHSDNGFYVNPSNNLDVFPVSGSDAAFTTGVYHNIVLTVDGTDVNAYIAGGSSLHAITGIMNIANGNNPDDLIHLFLDNVEAGGQNEWHTARIASALFYDGVLTEEEVRGIDQNPFPPGVPEPSTWAMMLLGFGSLGALLRRRRTVHA